VLPATAIEAATATVTAKVLLERNTSHPLSRWIRATSHRFMFLIPRLRFHDDRSNKRFFRSPACSGWRVLDLM